MTKKRDKIDDSLDDFAESLQKEIIEKEREIFSKKVIDEFNDPSNLGRLERPDGDARITGPCGDTMEIYLKIEKERITNVVFMTDGCGPTVACGSMVSKMITGKKTEEAIEISDEDLINALDGLPEENKHCAKLTIDTLKKAVRNYIDK
jgi:nitrogen fixation NifU-like protein